MELGVDWMDVSLKGAMKTALLLQATNRTRVCGRLTFGGVEWSRVIALQKRRLDVWNGSEIGRKFRRNMMLANTKCICCTLTVTVAIQLFA